MEEEHKQTAQAADAPAMDTGEQDTQDTQEKPGTQDPPGTIYDDVFRKMAQYYPELFVALINEVYGFNFPKDTPIRQLRNEYYEWDGKYITDVIFEVAGRLFHFECQSRPDGTMEIRMIEYSFSIALDRMRMDGSDVLQLPYAAVVYLRHTENTPDVFQVTLRNAEGDTMPLRFRCVKVKEYSREAIFARKLLMFLPYYAMRYEKDWERMEQDPERKEQFLNDFREAVAHLRDSVGEYGDLLTNDLLQMMRDIAHHLLRKHKDIQKGVEEIMTDRLGPLPSEIIREELRQEYGPIIAAKDALIRRKDKALSRKDKALSRQKETLSRQKETLSRQKETLSQKDEALNRQKETLNRQDSIIEALKAQIVAMGGTPQMTV